MRRKYPNFLKNDAKILGVEFVDICILGTLLSVASFTGLSNFEALALIGSTYGLMILKRRFFAKRYFEFVLTRKRIFKWANIRKIEGLNEISDKKS